MRPYDVVRHVEGVAAKAKREHDEKESARLADYWQMPNITKEFFDSFKVPFPDPVPIPCTFFGLADVHPGKPTRDGSFKFSDSVNAYLDPFEKPNPTFDHRFLHPDNYFHYTSRILTYNQGT